MAKDVDVDVNYRAWLVNALQFMDERGMIGDFTNWCGGWKCPVDYEKRTIGPIKKLRAGFDYPCSFHRGPKGDCNEGNCKCM